MHSLIQKLRERADIIYAIDCDKYNSCKECRENLESSLCPKHYADKYIDAVRLIMDAERYGYLIIRNLNKDI